LYAKPAQQAKTRLLRMFLFHNQLRAQHPSRPCRAADGAFGGVPAARQELFPGGWAPLQAKRAFAPGVRYLS